MTGFGGLLFGSLLKPYEPNVGAHGAAFGLLGMNYVELVQAWKLVEHPERPLIKLTIYTILGLAVGFMPEVGILRIHQSLPVVRCLTVKLFPVSVFSCLITL